MSRVYPPPSLPPPPQAKPVIKNSRLLTCTIHVTIGGGIPLNRVIKFMTSLIAQTTPQVGIGDLHYISDHRLAVNK